MKIYIRLPGGQDEGPFDAWEVLDSFLAGKIPSDAMVGLEGDPPAWLPIASVFGASVPPNQSLKRLAWEQSIREKNKRLKFVSWIFVAAFFASVAGVVVVTGLISLWTEIPRIREGRIARIASIKKPEREARENRLNKLLIEYDAVLGHINNSIKIEGDHKTNLGKLKKEEEYLKTFGDLGEKVIHYHAELRSGPIDAQRLQALGTEALTLPSPCLIYYGVDGLELYLRDYDKLNMEFQEKAVAYQDSVSLYEKKGTKESWAKKKEYLELQIEAVQSVLE